LAAPFIAAGAGVIIGGAGAAALGSIAGVAVIGSLFGVAGAGLTGTTTICSKLANFDCSCYHIEFNMSVNKQEYFVSVPELVSRGRISIYSVCKVD
jgi:Protein of unknown function (DUF726)